MFDTTILNAKLEYKSSMVRGFVQSMYDNFYIKTKTGEINALSTREIEVCCLLPEGPTSKLLAKRFNSSPKTIESHIERVKTKTDISCKSGLTKFSLDTLTLYRKYLMDK